MKYFPIIFLGIAIVSGIFLLKHFSPTAQILPPPDEPTENILSQITNNEPATSTGTNLPKQQKSAATSASQKSLTQACSGSNAANFDCYEKYYRALVDSKGIPAAFADLKSVYPLNAYVQSQCHPLTHILGQEAVKQFAKVADAYLHGDSFCWSGYYHGVMEGIVGRIGRKNLIAQIDSICNGIPGKEHYSFDYYNCVHGLGHGVMAISNDELFDSLATCDSLTGNWEKTSCYSGVFMENIIVDGKNHFTKYLKPDDPLYPCNAVGDPYKERCYIMQTSYMMKIFHADFKQIFAACEKADPGYADTCYESLGRDASGSSVSDVTRTKDTCLLGKSFEAQNHCIIGAAKDFVSYFHSDVQAKNLCAALPKDLSFSCNSTVDTYYLSFK